MARVPGQLRDLPRHSECDVHVRSVREHYRPHAAECAGRNFRNTRVITVKTVIDTIENKSDCTFGTLNLVNIS